MNAEIGAYQSDTWNGSSPADGWVSPPAAPSEANRDVHPPGTADEPQPNGPEIAA